MMTEPRIYRKDDNHESVWFRCDDGSGFQLQVLRSCDGDLWLQIVADPDHEDFRVNIEHISGMIRLRMPMGGGGMQETLFAGVLEAFSEAKGEADDA